MKWPIIAKWRHGDHDADSSVMNTFVVFLSRVIGYAVDSFLRKGDSEFWPGIGYMVTTIVLTSCWASWLAWSWPGSAASAKFRADAGAAQLMGRKQPMINALARLGGLTPVSCQGMAAMGITGGLQAVLHPPAHRRAHCCAQQG